MSQSSLNTHLEKVVVVVGGGGGEWKPILVYSSGPTFELELEFDLTWPDHDLTMFWPCPDHDHDHDYDLEWDLQWDLEEIPL